MSDAMCCGYYPHDPVPGPLRKKSDDPTWDWVMVDGVRMPRFAAYINSWQPKPSPVLESPMYFPGANWNADAVYA